VELIGIQVTSVTDRQLPDDDVTTLVSIGSSGHDERTRLRFSRISNARCADMIRSSASAGGPLSWSVHPVTAARAMD